jgi:hypothetical protein
MTGEASMKKVVTVLAMAACLGALGACKKNPQEQAADNYEANVDANADNMVAGTENAADNMTATTDNAADAMKDAANNKADAMKAAADNTADAMKNGHLAPGPIAPCGRGRVARALRARRGALFLAQSLRRAA